MEKHFISANELLIDSFKLAKKIHLSDYQPNFIIGLWRGGSPIAIAIQEYFTYMGVQVDHFPIRTTSYTGIAQRSNNVSVDGLEQVFDKLNAKTKLLIVDDIYDSGRSIQAVLENIKSALPAAQTPKIKTACVWFKAINPLSDAPLDFYLHKTDQWLVFPHELVGLSLDEVARSKPDIADLVSPNS